MKALFQHATDQGESAFVLSAPIGICGHREQPLSFLLALVPKQCSQVPFWKETSLTTPNSLGQYLPKWKMGCPGTFQRLRWGSQRTHSNLRCVYFSDDNTGIILIDTTPPRLTGYGNLYILPGGTRTFVRIWGFHPWNCHAFITAVDWVPEKSVAQPLRHTTLLLLLGRAVYTLHYIIVTKPDVGWGQVHSGRNYSIYANWKVKVCTVYESVSLCVRGCSTKRYNEASYVQSLQKQNTEHFQSQRMVYGWDLGLLLLRFMFLKYAGILNN